MLDDKIQTAIQPILQIYSKIELEIIKLIAEHFNVNEEFINSDYWYFEKLKELGALNNETLKLLEVYTGKTKHELLQAMKNIGLNSLPVQQLNLAEERGQILNKNAILDAVNVQNIITYSYNQIENTFLQLNKTIEEKTRQVYMDILTQAYIETSAGISSYQNVILKCLDELGNKGISILQYQTSTGARNYDVVGTVRRDLLVATRGLAAKINEEVVKASGSHIIRVSNHFGARTGDGQGNYTNHAWWQEKQYFCWNYDGRATDEEKRLPDFIECCNYGHVQGIVGINCKHFFTIWYGPLIKDKLDYTYDENQVQYGKTQQQRYLESGVRKWKRKQVVARASQDKENYEKASAKVTEWQDRLRTFTEENELKRDYVREHIKGYRSIKALNKNKQYVDITDNVLKKNKHKYNIEEQQYFIDDNGIKYVVDNKHVLLEPTQREKEVANMLGEIYGEKVNIIPRINEPKDIKTPDYIVKNKKYDLKQIKGSGKYVIQGNLKGKQKQADNFIIDITNSHLNTEEAIRQIQSIYDSKHYLWVDRILLVKNKEFLKIYKRK